MNACDFVERGPILIPMISYKRKYEWVQSGAMVPTLINKLETLAVDDDNAQELSKGAP